MAEWEMCNGICVTAADIGVGGYDQVAYPHPDCPAHGDPHEFKDSGKTHDTHDGLLRICECGAYEDEHISFKFVKAWEGDEVYGVMTHPAST